WVALKTITQDKSARSEFVRRFRREAVAAGGLDHPNIVTIYETGEEGDVCYIAMQFLEGTDLETLIKSPDWDVEFNVFRKLDISIQVCRGLAYAHNKGVIHRDVKPANIMILPDGTAKIVDFGIARIGETTSTSVVIVGTAPYMAPEQLEGNMVDERADIFAVGVLTYRMFTKRLPFEANNPAGVLYKIVHGPPPRVTAYVPDCPPDLERIVLTALAKDRDQRYPSMEELGFDFQRLLSSLNTALVSSYLEEARRLLAMGAFPKTKELLRKVLELEPANVAATEMWQQVQKLIQEEHNRRKAESLREEGIQAYRRSDWVRALECFKQGLQLDPANETLLSYRDLTLREQEKIQAFTQKTKAAQAAERRGELTVARDYLAEALQISPQNAEAQSLLAHVEAELAQAQKRREAQQLVDRAQRAITARHYPEATTLLEKAGALDPENRHVERLRSTAVEEQAAAQKQRLRGEKIAAAKTALEKGAFSAAVAEAESGLQAFPDDPALQQLLRDAKQGGKAAELVSNASSGPTRPVGAAVEMPVEQPTVQEDTASSNAPLEARGESEARHPGVQTLVESLLGSGTRAYREEERITTSQGGTAAEPPRPGQLLPRGAARLVGALDRLLARFSPALQAQVRGAVERSPAGLRLAIVSLGLTAVVFAVALTVWVFAHNVPRRRVATPTIVPPGMVSLDVSPWAKLDEVRNLKTQQPQNVAGQVTPLEFALPAGDYEAVVEHPTLGKMQFQFRVTAGVETPIRKSFEGFDAQQVLKGYQ
ncbi:MAG TPA: protein kinase, partial [Terriglobia bacterium]|nr:protein kinase [Terriglobia bacterium]